MPDDKRNQKLDELLGKAPNPRDKKLNDLLKQVPSTPDLPDVPKVSVTLPPDPNRKIPVEPDAPNFGKMGLAASAASSFIAPIIVLTLVGYLLDKNFGRSQGLYVIGGVVLGFVVGISSLMNIMKKMQ